MKNLKLVSLIYIILSAINSEAQQAFTVHLVPSSITAAPAVHSGAFAIRDAKWIFIGGRLDGIHNMQGGQAFPTYNRNDSIFVVDPGMNTYKSASARQFPAYMFEALCSNNMEFYQDGQFLYMIGGYGREDSGFAWITFSSLIKIDLDCMMSNIDAGTSISGCARMLIDSNLAVTGGGLEKIDSTFYLVFGHKFDGLYTPPPSPLFTQVYTHQIRKFTIGDDGVNLSINNYSAQVDTNNFHRRDFNLVPQVYPNYENGFTAFGGVFQKQNNLPFLTPVDITGTTVQHVSTFNENLNQYTTATMPVYDSINNFMHTIFFGGMSQYTLDTATMALIEDTLVPFVSTISKVSRDAAGNLTESKILEDMPALKGTNAMFIPDTQMLSYRNGRILNLNSMIGNQKVGYIVGGIHSDFANVANIDPNGMSRANTQVYEVYIDKNVNAIPELQLNNEVNNLKIFPNPANDNFSISFSVKNETPCEIKLFNVKGQLVKTLLQEKKLKGEQSFSFATTSLKDGVYFGRVRVGKSVKVARVVVSR